MGTIALGIYLIIVGLLALTGLAVPAWAVGIIAVIAGILILTGK